MRAVNDAWSVLGDAQRRRSYDLSLRQDGPVPGPGRGGSSGAGGASGASGATAGPRPGPEQLRDWRSYASPGAGAATPKSTWEQLVVMSPVLLLLAAGLFGGAAALVGWEGFFAAALVCLMLAGAAFFMLPIWVMARTGRRGRRSGRGRPTSR